MCSACIDPIGDTKLECNSSTCRDLQNNSLQGTLPDGLGDLETLHLLLVSLQYYINQKLNRYGAFI